MYIDNKWAPSNKIINYYFIANILYNMIFILVVKLYFITYWKHFE